MEDVISEFRVIETEDGYRIEIKGDKEKLKSFFRGFGGRKHWRKHRRHHRHGRPPFFFEPMMWWMRSASCFGPWDIEFEVEDEEDEEEAEES
jgi:hypothetical protein